MSLVRVKYILRRVDSRIITILSRTQEGKVTISSPIKTIHIDGDEQSILRSINEYDRAVLTRLVARNSRSINGIPLKIYNVTKGYVRNEVKRALKVARKVRARVKDVD